MTGDISNLRRVWEASTAWERDDGRSYYGRCRDAVLDVGRGFGFYGVAELSGMFAALSPNNDEAGNFRDLSRVVEAYSAGALKPPVTSSYPVNAQKAWRIAKGTPPDLVLGGKKVIAFWHNVLDPSDRFHVTVDGQMVSCWHGSRLNLRRRENGKESATITSRQYDAIASDIRDLSRDLRVLPSALQSTLWLTWKRLHRIRYTPQLTLPL